MLFTQIEFVVFFAVVLAVGFRLSGRWRNAFLLTASYWFYCSWDLRLGLILLGTTVVHWLAIRILSSDVGERTRKAAVWGAVGVSVGALGYFKYCNFFLTSWNAVMGSVLSVETADVILPLGISFYTFQAISLTIDMYRQKIDPPVSFLDVAVYISFFPQLLSGPIVRYGDFAPQLNASSKLKRDDLLAGFGMFSFGFFKKVFVADRMTAYVGYCFENCGMMNSASLWLGALAYTIQIYCDFSGYSDMAIGVARAMGFRYKANFNHPYVSRSVTEFWRRWHISLSTWLRDYVYIALGGNRCGKTRRLWNLLATMLVGGLWHGANWTFIAWGGLHGVALIVHKLWVGVFPEDDRRYSGRVRNLLGWVLTLFVVTLGWVLFRADNFGMAWIYLSGLFGGGAAEISWISPYALGGIALVVFTHCIGETKWGLKIRDVKTPMGLYCVLTAFALALLYPADGANPFIYFQF